MCNTTACKQAVDETITALGGLDIVISNAVCVLDIRQLHRGWIEEEIRVGKRANFHRAGQSSRRSATWMQWMSRNGIGYVKASDDLVHIFYHLISYIRPVHLKGQLH